MTTVLRPHRMLPDGLTLLDRPPRGYELAVVEVVETGDDTADVVDVQTRAWVRGGIGGHAVGVLLQVWTDRRIPTHRLARDHAMGRLTGLTEKVRVWEAHRVVGGRPGPIVSRHESFDEALRALVVRR